MTLTVISMMNDVDDEELVAVAGVASAAVANT